MPLVLYGSSGDVRGELGNPSEVEYSADDIDRARTRATNVVNAYLQQSYGSIIPFALGTEPELLKSITNDLSVYYAKRSKHPTPLPLTEEVKTEYYDKSIDLLKLISEGEMALPGVASALGENFIAPQSEYSPTFNEDSEIDWEIDQDKLDDIQDQRDN